MMFREMRRRRQALPEGECVAILERMTSGVLAVEGDGGYPYAVPLSYVYAGGKLYFHSAREGHKVDALRRNAKASFCVVERDEVVAEEYTTYFRSVVVFGQVRFVEEEREKLAALELLAEKYAPGERERRQREIAQGFDHLYVLELDVECMTGKEAVEFLRQRKGGG